MNRTLLAAALVLVALVPAFALAHPPAFDPHNSCVVRDGKPAEDVPRVPVDGTLSYLELAGRSLPCKRDFHYSEFGSHAKDCPPPPTVGAIAGAYCGPLVLPGDTATCSWKPVLLRYPQEIYGFIIAFDRPAGPLPTLYNGFIRFSDGEVPVFGPFPPGAWTVPNPYPGEIARVIAFPTNAALPPDPSAGALSPADLHEVGCVTP